MRRGIGWVLGLALLAVGMGARADESPPPATETKDEELARLRRERQALDARIRELEGQRAEPPAQPMPSPPAQSSPPASPSPRGRIVVTDSRLERDVATTGRSVTVVDEAAIEASGKREAQEVLRDIPSAQVVRTAGRGGTTSLFTRGGEADYTTVMVDGVRMNKDGGSFDFESLGVDEVERLEFMRGAGSALYGSDAMAGVLNLVTRRGEGPATMKTSFEYGTFETMRERFSVSGGDERFGYRLGGSNLQQRGSVFHNSDFDDRNFAARFDAKLSPDMDMTAHFRSVESHLGVYTTTAGAAFQPTDPNDTKDRSDALMAVRFTSRVSPSWRSMLSLHRYTNDVKFNTRKDPGEVGEASENYSLTTFARQGGSWQNDWTLGGGHTFTAGVDYETEDFDQVKTTIGSTATATNQVDKTRTDRAVFVQDVWSWDDRLVLTLGGRRNDNTSFGREDTGQAAFSWKTAERGPRLHSSLGNGIKVPTFSEIYGTTTSPGLLARQEGVRVERSRTFDAGLEQAWGKVTLDATWFEHRYKDLVELESTAAGYGQGGEAVARGWEFALDADLSERLRLHGDLTVMDTNVLSTKTTGTAFVVGDELLRRARLQSNASATYKPTKGLSTRLGMRYMGSRVDRNFGASSSGFRQRLGSYTLFDAASSWTLPDPRWRLFATAENLLDLQYSEIIGFPSPGFNMMAGVEYSHAF